VEKTKNHATGGWGKRGGDCVSEAAGRPTLSRESAPNPPVGEVIGMARVFCVKLESRGGSHTVHPRLRAKPRNRRKICHVGEGKGFIIQAKL